MALAFHSVCSLAHIHLFLSVKAIISEVRKLRCGISIKTAHQNESWIDLLSFISVLSSLWLRLYCAVEYWEVLGVTV